MSTIKNADLIISIETGRVIEHGTHNELMVSKGLYYTLVNSQTEKEQTIEAGTEWRDDEEKDKQEIDEQQIEGILDFDDSNQTLDESTKTKNIQHRNSIPYFLLSLLRLNSPECYFIIMGSIASLLLGMTTPGFALFLAEIYKLFTEPDLIKQARLTRLFSIGIFLSGLVGGICIFVASWAFAKSGEELVMRIRRRIFASLLRQEISYFDQESNSVGVLMVRLSSDASALKVNQKYFNATNRIVNNRLFLGFDRCSRRTNFTNNRYDNYCSNHCVYSWLETYFGYFLYYSSHYSLGESSESPKYNKQQNKS